LESMKWRHCFTFTFTF